MPSTPTPQIGAIAAMSESRLIGLDNDIPWRYPADWKRFKQVTLGSTVIMGRKTWESIGSKPLPKRQNIVLTRAHLSGVDVAKSIKHGLTLASRSKIWFIGGGNLYAQALEYCQLLDITWVPDQPAVPEGDGIYFPEIRIETWQAGPRTPLQEDTRLTLQQFTRIDAAECDDHS